MDSVNVFQLDGTGKWRGTAMSPGDDAGPIPCDLEQLTEFIACRVIGELCWVYPTRAHAATITAPQHRHHGSSPCLLHLPPIRSKGPTGARSQVIAEEFQEVAVPGVKGKQELAVKQTVETKQLQLLACPAEPTPCWQSSCKQASTGSLGWPAAVC